MSHRKRMLRHGPRTGVLAASIGALIASGGLSSTALGQDEDDEDADDNNEQVVVTGTRIRRDDYTAVNATVVITADDMRDLGIVSVADAINQLPSNVANQTLDTNTDVLANFGMTVANLRGLNSAFGTSTLVMVDSNRVVPTTSGGQVDLNLIPTALVGRIEVVTGGASATYGADAMAGVINVIVDSNIEGIRVDLSYNTDSYGTGGEQVNLSLGTGFEVLDRRGRVTLGYDYGQTNPIPDCTARAYCERSLGLLQNGGSSRAVPGYPLTSPPPFYPNEPHYIVREGMRYTALPEGMMMSPGAQITLADLDPMTYDPDTFTNPAFPELLVDGVDINQGQAFSEFTAMTNFDAFVMGMWITSQSYSPNSRGTYRFSEDGKSILPYLDDLDPLIQDYVIGLGTSGVSPFGDGDLQYKNQALRSENERNNIFTQFNYDFENGIALNARLSYNTSKTMAEQNSQRNSGWNIGGGGGAGRAGSCLLPDNAFLSDEWGASPALQDLISERRVWIDGDRDGVNDAYDPFSADPTGGTGGCRPGPFQGQSYLDDDETIELYDFPEAIGTTGIYKSVHPFVNRYSVSDNSSTDFRLGARGELFDGGSWTWDADIGYGFSERTQTLQGQRSTNRLDMALHSVWDSTANGGQGAPVCAIFSGEMYDGIWQTDNLPAGFVPPDRQFVMDSNNPITVGEYYTQKWLTFIDEALGEGDQSETAQFFFNSMAGLSSGLDRCAPINPFGLDPSPAGYRYAFPLQTSGSENDQLSLNFNFSGEIFRGVGAGPFRMAAGYNWRDSTSTNFADPNPYTAADYDERFADKYSGINGNEAAYVEFDLPLVRDKPGADYLSFNLGARKTQSTSERTEGDEGILTQKSTRSIDSWKASMVWRPLDILMVRATRSADTRAPSAQELFGSQQPALQTGALNERATPFRINDPTTDVNESLDFWDDLSQSETNQGSNSRLQEQTSITQTLGLVFTPTELLSGLQVSIDYAETYINGGIQTISVNQVMDSCAQELIANRWQYPEADYTFCGNVQFDFDPLNLDPTQQIPLPDFAQEADPDADPPVIAGTTGIPNLWVQAWEAGLPGFEAGNPNPFYEFSNVVSVAPSSENRLPTQSRNIDISISYRTQLAGGGSISARILATRALEQTVRTRGTTFAWAQGNIRVRDVSGQTGSSGIGGGGSSVAFGQSSNNVPLFSGYSPTPRIAGNLSLTYQKNALRLTGQVRYTGSGKLSNEREWYGPGEVASGLLGGEGGTLTYFPWAPGLSQTVWSNDLPSWAVLNVNFEYDFGRSRLQLDKFEQLSAYLNIGNIGNRIPDFYSGTSQGGINSTFFPVTGRTYRMGVRMSF